MQSATVTFGDGHTLDLEDYTKRSRHSDGPLTTSDMGSMFKVIYTHVNAHSHSGYGYHIKGADIEVRRGHVVADPNVSPRDLMVLALHWKHK